MKDLQGRSIEYVRISITDRCNLRCIYCMPEKGNDFIPPEQLLTFDEILRTASCMAGLGIRVVRLTGGEPMARSGCLDLISKLKRIEGIDRVTMTTNGALLRGHIEEALAAGLSSVNISIDALTPELYAEMTRGGNVEDVLECIHEAADAGLKVNLNVVPVKGINEGELEGLALLARDMPVDVRFIELMPVGCGKNFEPVRIDEVKRRITAFFGEPEADDDFHGMGPASYVKPHGFTGSIGFIGAVSHGFCSCCNRVRVTSDGMMKLCLNHQASVNLRGMMRSGCTDSELTDVIREAILNKPMEHGFLQEVEDPEFRCMNRIGG